MRSSLLFLLVSCSLAAVASLAGCSSDATPEQSTSDGGGGQPPGDGGACARSVSFDLAIQATGPVYSGGPPPAWPPSFGCGGYFTISPAGAAPLNLVKNGCGIPCAAPSPQPASAQSFSWDGTYYPVASSGEKTACATPVCAPAGNYVATFCAGYADADAGSGTSDPYPPTCKQVSFVWPPTPGESFSESITPTADGG